MKTIHYVLIAAAVAFVYIICRGMEPRKSYASKYTGNASVYDTFGMHKLPCSSDACKYQPLSYACLHCSLPPQVIGVLAYQDNPKS